MERKWIHYTLYLGFWCFFLHIWTEKNKLQFNIRLQEQNSKIRSSFRICHICDLSLVFFLCFLRHGSYRNIRSSWCIEPSCSHNNIFPSNNLRYLHLLNFIPILQDPAWNFIHFVHSFEDLINTFWFVQNIFQCYLGYWTNHKYRPNNFRCILQCVLLQPNIT